MQLTQAYSCDGINLVSVHSVQMTVVLMLCLCGYCIIRSQEAVEKQVCWQGPGSCCCFCCYGLPCCRVTKHVGSATDGAYVYALVLGPCVLDKRCTLSLPPPACWHFNLCACFITQHLLRFHSLEISLQVWNANFLAEGMKDSIVPITFGGHVNRCRNKYPVRSRSECILSASGLEHFTRQEDAPLTVFAY